jgi:two-component system sensor kinase FixL
MDVDGRVARRPAGSKFASPVMDGLARVRAWPRAYRIGVVAVLTIAGAAVRVGLADQLGDRMHHAMFYPALLSAALLVEAEGVIGVFLLAVAVAYAPPLGPPPAPLSDVSDFLELAVFALNSGMLLLLARALDRLSRARGEVDALDRINSDQLGHFVEQAPASMAMFDRNMRYLAASARWRDDFRLARDIVGKSHYEIFPEIGEEWKQIYARALAGETVRCDRDRFERDDGEMLWLRWEVRPWLHPSDGVGGVLIYCENISERVAIRQALEDNERRLKAILDSAMEAIVTIDARGKMVSANPAACEIFGYTLPELLGNNVDLLMPGPTRGEHSRYLTAYSHNRDTRIVGRRREIDGRRKDGSVFPLELTVSEAQDAGGVIFVGFMRDLSPIEEERRRVNALRDELVHVSRLNDMGEVVASLAHEVGQPVAAILNFAAAHRRAPAGPGAEADMIARIETQARRAAQILKRLRGFIEKRPAARQKENLADLIEEALHLSPRRSRAHVFFTPDSNCDVVVDRIQIEQVIVNLLRNADEALRHAETPEIQITIARSDPEHVSVSVADNGAGVEPEAREKLFSAFYSTKRFGMGVGLSICKSILEAHGGEIRFRPNTPAGAVFEFTLPAARG